MVKYCIRAHRFLIQRFCFVYLFLAVHVVTTTQNGQIEEADLDEMGIPLGPREGNLHIRS